jgi:crossover junction endodeoxyribonuclease RuvC
MGVAIIEVPPDGSYPKSRLLDYRTILCRGGSKYGRFVSLDRQLTEYCKEWKPHQAAFEKGFTGFGGKKSLEISAAVVAEARGVAMLSVARFSVEIYEYAQATVKKAATGSGRTKKHQVEMYIRALFNLPGILEEDAADAVAIGYTHSIKMWGAP